MSAEHQATAALSRPALLLAFLMGCSGVVGQEVPGDPGGTGTSSGQPGRPGGKPDDPRGGSSPGGPMSPGTNNPPGVGGMDPGRVALHRLSATQYNNTLVDLLGTSLRPGERFPSDFGGESDFDNNANRLTVSPLVVAVHDGATDELVDELWNTPTSRSRVVGCDPAAGAACIREVANGFGARAWRRPLQPAEVDRLAALFDKLKGQGATADEAARQVVKAILMSANFLYRVELDPDPMATTPRPLTGYEMASRLSYFLWNTMPDETLFAAAKANKLGSAAEVKAQVERMLGSPKAEALASSFGGQWMGTVELEKHEVHAQAFPAYDKALTQAMKREVELFFTGMLADNRPVSDLLLARFTHVNARLAKHYGLPAPATEWAKVDLGNSPRGGVLTFGGMLTRTSNPARTSVVKRGEYVAHAILCSELPDAPPDVPPLPEAGTGMATTQRERLEIHRRDPACNACHQLLDPIGFGLERFDAVGAWRDLDQGKPIDDAGQLPGGVAFRGPRELSNVLSQDGRSASCFVKNLTAYALGRQVRDEDRAYLEALAGGDSRRVGVKDLVTRIVTSDLFRLRRAAPDREEEGGAP